MKVLLLVCGCAAALVAAAVGCGPKQAYCPQNTTGLCLNDDGGSAPPPGPDTGLGETMVIGP